MKVLSVKFLFACWLICLSSYQVNAQNNSADSSKGSHIISDIQYKELMQKPDCLKQYRPNQSGPLHKIDLKNEEQDDSTFTVQIIDMPSNGVMIHGWLYLPKGNAKYPLVVLTNGGGDDSRPIKSMSDFMAPIFAHCGIAAFVHDKRGTGKSGGIFKETTYEDYVIDAGNCAIFLSKHKNINPDMIGVMGASEGGRIAILTASRYPVINFVISFAGTMVSSIDDRLYAQLGGYKTKGLSDTLINEIYPFWKASFEAWASMDPSQHEKIDKNIKEWRKKYDASLVPYSKKEMDSIPAFQVVLPTWNSLQFDYLTEMKHFNKKWLAVYGAIDQVVPTFESVKNIQYYMSLSVNKDYSIAIIPKCGHVPVDIDTKLRVEFENLILNWLYENVLN